MLIALAAALIIAPLLYATQDEQQMPNILTKLILSGSLLAHQTLHGQTPDRQLAENWNRLLQECNQQGMLNNKTYAQNQWAQQAAELLKNLVIADQQKSTKTLPAKAIKLLDQYEKQLVNPQGN